MAKQVLGEFVRTLGLSWVVFSGSHIERELSVENMHIISGTIFSVLFILLMRLLYMQPHRSIYLADLLDWVSGKVVIWLVVQLLLTVLLSLYWSWLLDDAKVENMMDMFNDRLPLGWSLIGLVVYIKCYYSMPSEHAKKSFNLVLTHLKDISI